VEGFESQLVLIVFFALGLYLLINGKINVEVSTGSFDANNRMNKVYSSVPVKTKGLAVRALGLIICLVTSLVYFKIIDLGV
jgi:hypothetical protein